MAEELGITTFILVLVVLIVFAWLVKLSYDLRKAMQTGFNDVDSKVDSLEEAAVGIKNELDKLRDTLDDKISKAELEKRVEEVVKAGGGKTAGK